MSTLLHWAIARQEMLPPDFNTCDDVDTRCVVEATIYGDYFTTGACIFFVVAYGLLLISQLYLGYRSRAWSFCLWLLVGTISELMGYAGRLVMSYNPWIYDAFVIQLVMLILGPTFVAASISITFKHLVLFYGPEWSFLKPTLYPWVFVGTDFFSIAIQAVGGVMSAIATGEEFDRNLLNTGGDLLVAGVVFQAANMLFCGGLMLIYLYRRHKGLKNGGARLQSSAGEAAPAGPVHSEDEKRKAKIFVYAITVAYIAIITRCIYRYVVAVFCVSSEEREVLTFRASIPEMQTGWASDLMQNETLFLILDGAMILFAVLTLTIFHPAFFFLALGRAGFSFSRKNKKSAAESGESTEMDSYPNSVMRSK